MVKPFVSIIIVNWNGKKFLDSCLGSLSTIAYKNVEIIFVDNASSDRSVEFVKANYPKVVIIHNKKNLGLSGGHDVAFKKAKGDAVLLLNTDTIVGKRFLNELVAVLFSNQEYGGVQPKLIIPKYNVIDSIGSFFLPGGNLYHFGREKNPHLGIYNKTMEIFSTKAACMLIKTTVLKKTGLFDKDFFVYFEDTDLCMRIWLAGYKVIYTPKTIVYHKGGGASKQMPPSYIEFHSYKNRICTYIKNLSPKYLLSVLPVMIFLYEVAASIYICTGKISIAWAIQKGIIWNIIHVKQTLRKRRYIQKYIRVVSDDDFIPKLTRNVRLSYYFYQIFGGMEKYVD
jgi:GT2 family glycosyltransferase